MSLGLCFPKSAKLWLNEDGTQTVGIWNLNQSKVDSFLTYLHYEPEAEVEFLEFICKNGASVSLSGEHLIFQENGQPTAAKNIQVGEKLIYKNQPVEVVQINQKVEKGAYAPMTKSGTVIVDGFLASCYAHVRSHEIAHKTLAPLRFWYRNMSKLSFYKKKQPKEQPAQGIHKYAKALNGIRNIVRAIA